MMSARSVSFGEPWSRYCAKYAYSCPRSTSRACVAFASLDPDSRVRDWAARVPEVRSRCGQQFGFDELTPGYGDATCGACAGVSDKAYSAA